MDVSSKDWAMSLGVAPFWDYGNAENVSDVGDTVAEWNAHIVVSIHHSRSFVLSHC